jgi:multidrug resistance efflux pump
MFRFLLNRLAIVCFLVFWACGKSNKPVKPVVKPIIEAVYASGYVVAKNEYEVYAQTEGYLVEKLVDEGDEVVKGKPLFILDADQQSARYRISKENYDMAVLNYGSDSPVLNELTSALQASQTKLRYDSINLVRYTNLLNSNAVTRSDFDRVKLTYENSKDEYALQKSRYEKTKNQLYLELKNAENQLRIATDESKRYIIRSNVDGMIFSSQKEKGELIRRGEVIAVVGQRDGFYLELNVDELDISKVQSGQKVIVKVDAYPDKTFNAVVDKVYPMINRQQQSVRVDALLTEQLQGWFSGLALEANIIIREKPDALVISKTMLLPGDSVLIETGDGRKKIKVEKGIETIDEVEIVNGLDTTHRLVGAVD